ncbi:MAG: DUF4926 domain-containing protein [Caldilineaceae bacterium]
MKIELYEQVTLKQDIEAENLRKGDVATLIDYVAHPAGREMGAILEFFNAIGESIAVLTVPISAIAPLSSDYILSARPLVAAA